MNLNWNKIAPWVCVAILAIAAPFFALALGALVLTFHLIENDK